VILQDLIMPGIDGLEMVGHFRRNPATAAVPVIVLSAREEPVVKARLLDAGASDYLVKLPDRVELIARIRVHSDGYRRLLERNAAFEALERSLADLKREKIDLLLILQVTFADASMTVRIAKENLAPLAIWAVPEPRAGGLGAGRGGRGLLKPVELVAFGPLAALAKFIAHEIEFFAWCGHLVSHQQTQVGEFLPSITGHFIQ
jgi:hypothetical protein